ncbi:signal peptide peptidase SppA [Bryocella elongata]|uniref:Signal peptide peptidase SppA n=1 Tax=Bryocella elongata TaxID=863522 RepID=A0A1H6B637_9BACT|nr:S49 family peptidase [Bryocella elongata]SEG56289.1 signal peptide peptidase SppA [Bryocella elongata]
MRQYSAILAAMRTQRWAVMPEYLEGIYAVLEMKALGGSASADTLAKIQAETELQAARAQKVQSASTGSVAVLPLYGLILHRGSAMGDMCGPQATSTMRFLRQYKAAVSDPNVTAIVIDVDSPGGTVEGVDELATEIRNSRGKKQTIACVNMLCASAAYYAVAGATEIVASPSSKTGSIGVYCVHQDASEWFKKQGIANTLIKFGENKAEGNPYEPLSDAAKQHIQDSVDEAGDAFESAVAAGRKVSKKTVHDTFGQGLCFGAKQALKLGMVDSIDTFDNVLARFGVSVDSPSTQMSTFRERLDSQSAVKNSADDSDLTVTCTCSCDPCGNGDCDGCTVTDCSADGCTCSSASAKHSERKSKARQREIELAAL